MSGPLKVRTLASWGPGAFSLCGRGGENEDGDEDENEDEDGATL